jgi:CBS domain-containing protein
MDAERAEIRQFLSVHNPFDLLPEDVLDSLAGQIEVVRAAAETTLLRPEDHVRALYLVRSGRIELRGKGGEVWAQCSEGETFGVRALLKEGRAMFWATPLEDSTLYLLADKIFARLRLEHREFERFFTPLGGNARRLSHADDRLTADRQTNLIALRVRDLMTPDAVTIEADRPVRQAAMLMREHRISCLPVTTDGALTGVVTNVDLRDRVVAEGVAAETPVAAVMTPEPLTLAAEGLAFDGLLAMRERTVKHMPVMRDGRLVGILTNTDVLRRQINHPGYLSGMIMRRETPAGLAEVVAQVPQLLVILVETGVTGQQIGLTVSSITDATAYRLLQLAEQQLGPPPIPYVWVASGSQARQEQTGLSDQDNCMIIDDAYDEAEHGGYFKDLAQFVCDGLHACGYVYCPGEMMAMTPKWRQPLAQWKRYFTAWIEEPEPMAQMLASVLFDLRPIRGETRLFDELQADTFEKAKKSSFFVAHIVSNALTHTPPLGFFRNFILKLGGKRGKTLDMKFQGTVPIIDIARVYALRAGVTLANTHDRLVAAQRAGELSDAGMQDLIDALEFLSLVRLQHQSRQIKAGELPDNLISPDELSRIERQHLREAFLIVQTMQSSLANTYQIRR